jgi:hypothetical protein
VSTDSGGEQEPADPRDASGPGARFDGATGVQVGSGNFQVNFYGFLVQAGSSGVPLTTASELADSPQRPPTVPQRTAALVRKCLLEPPQPSSLYVVPRSHPENYVIRNARAVHSLEKDEALIAVWGLQGPTFFNPKASSLVFTSYGIRIFQRKTGLFGQPERTVYIPYSQFNKCEFTWNKSRANRIIKRLTPTSPAVDVDVYSLKVAGPVQWEWTIENEPLAPVDPLFSRTVEHLNYIKTIAAIRSGQEFPES